MSNGYIHVGPYVTCRWRMRDEVVEQNKCLDCGLEPENPEHKFCPMCGDPVLTEDHPYQEPITLFDFDESEALTEAFNATDKDGVGVLLPNRSGYDLGSNGYYHKEIHHEQVERVMAKFEKDYAETLSLLRENADYVQVKFGIVSYYF